MCVSLNIKKILTHFILTIIISFMKVKLYIISALLAVVTSLDLNAQQPYGGCWHPRDIKSWSPENDPVAKFNRSRVPLAKRFQEPVLMKANNAQHYEGQICNATILFNMCSLSPSQGADNFIGYQPTYWQYMDKLVYWAGSASEGIIIPPPAGSIDAAHQAGVKILGQIFFPPKDFGGDPEWVQEIVVKEDGKYPYAKKLYEIAKYLGFDGWFINQETPGSGVKSATWAEFIKEFNSYADAAGDTQMEIMYYNALGVIDAPILKSHKNTSMFLEYYSEGDYRHFAKDINCTEAETFSKIYAGVQCVRSGLTGYQSSLDKAFPASGHVGSLALFCPEERSWKDNVRNLLGTPDDNGEKAYAAIKQTFENEEQAWVNTAGDPSTGGNSSWTGISGAVLERSAITSMPFVSNMCVGVGKHRFVNGEKQGTQDWYHSGVQSVLPTWRWWIENRGNLKVSIDWDDAYNHGSSFKISGNLSGKALMRLYKTMIPVENGGIVRVVFKGADTPELKLSTASSVAPDVTLSAANTSKKNGWTIAEYDLSSLKGKTIYMVALNLIGSGSFNMNLGQLAILPGSYTPATVAVENLQLSHRLDENGGDIRVTWDFDWNDDFDHFDVYITTASGRKLIGQTRDEAFYIPALTREGSEDAVKVEVVPVTKDMVQQTPVSKSAEYPKPGAPIVSLKLSKSCVKVGETVTITANGTGSPTAWKWIIPETLQLVEGNLTDNVITVKALAEGTQKVTVESTNSLGTSSTGFDAIDVVSENEYNNLHNIALHKKIYNYSGCTNSKETPENLIDGITNPSSTSQKWCNVSPDNWVIIDCQSLYRIYGFKIYDCKSGPENNENIRNYTIEVSADCKNWTKVVDEKDKSSVNIKEDYIVPTMGRYIRFSPSVSGTLRVWEFEAYGIDNVKMTIDVNPTEFKVNSGDTKYIDVNYNLNGDDRDPSFACNAIGGNNVEIGDITEDMQAHKFVIPVTGGELMGESDILITVSNGAAYKEAGVKVYIDNESRPNILAGLDAKLRHYKEDYSTTAAFDETTVNTLTDGNTEKEACKSIENPSSHTDDFWAIFEAPEIWHLSKVKVYIPENNRGENDNDNEGNINNTISIAVGKSLDKMTRVKTFENLSDISELEFIFPEYRDAKYLAIICNLNPFFYPSLAEVEAYEQVESAVPVCVPLEVTGWTDDVIAEGLPSKSYVTGQVDSDNYWSLYTPAVQEKGAIAGDDRMVHSVSGLKYQLQPYDQKNSVTLRERYDEAILTLKTPVLCQKFHLLAFSGDDFQAAINVTPIFEDDSEGDEKYYSLSRWDRDDDYAIGKTFGVVFSGKTDRYQTTEDEIDDNDHFLREKTYSFDVNNTKKLKAIKIESDKWYVANILAVSGTGLPSEMSGIDEIIITPEEDDAIPVAYYNIQGIEVKNPSSGFYIVRYSNGTTKKIVIK